MGMWLYNRVQQKLKWKDPRIFNAETQAHDDVGGLGIREGIRPRWSCRFRLDGLDV
jgi:hypothetical protein